MIAVQKKFQDIIRDIRKANHMSQEEAAKRMKIARSTLASYEAGLRKPGYDILKKMSAAYDVDYDVLLKQTGDWIDEETMLDKPRRVLLQTISDASEEEVNRIIKVIEAMRS